MGKMGLDVSHGAWSGAYSWFMQWRQWVAGQIGLPLRAMEGFSGADSWTFVGKGRNPVTAEYLPIPWALLTPDPIHELLNHSDCGGSIPLGVLPDVERRLREIAKAASDAADTKGILGLTADEDMIQLTYRFADGCSRAIAAGENLEFS